MRVDRRRRASRSHRREASAAEHRRPTVARHISMDTRSEIQAVRLTIAVNTGGCDELARCSNIGAQLSFPFFVYFLFFIFFIEREISFEEEKKYFCCSERIPSSHVRLLNCIPFGSGLTPCVGTKVSCICLPWYCI